MRESLKRDWSIKYRRAVKKRTNDITITASSKTVGTWRIDDNGASQCHREIFGEVAAARPRAAEASSSSSTRLWRRRRRWLSFRVRSCAVGGGGARVCAPAVTAERSAGRHECARYRSATWSRSSPASQWRSGRSSCVVFTSVRVPRNDHVSDDRVLQRRAPDQHAPASFFL